MICLPCSIVAADPTILGGRVGTVRATEAEIVAKFGKPQPVKSADEKVTKRWVISTPRGFAELRDYWWNAADEWSIAAAARKPAQWAKRFLRRQGLNVA